VHPGELFEHPGPAHRLPFALQRAFEVADRFREPAGTRAAHAHRQVEVGARGQPGGLRGGPGDLEEVQRLGRRVVDEGEPAGGEARRVHLLRGPVDLAQRVVPGGGVHVPGVGAAGGVEDLGDALVQPAQPGRVKLGQQRLPDPVVQEPVPARPGRGDQPPGLRLGERLPALAGVDAADARHQIGAELPAGRRARGQQPPALLAEPVDALQDEVEGVAGQFEPVEPGQVEPPAAPRRGDQAGVDDRPHVLDHGERVAADPGDQFVGDPAGHPDPTEVQRDQVGDRIGVELGQPDPGVEAATEVGLEAGQRGQAVEVVPAGGDHQQRGVPQPGGHLLEHPPGRAVEPLHVVDVQHRSLADHGQVDQERGDGVGELLVAVLGAGVGGPDEVGQQRRQGAQQRPARAGRLAQPLHGEVAVRLG
jgi:hypothetical protein